MKKAASFGLLRSESAVKFFNNSVFSEIIFVLDVMIDYLRYLNLKSMQSLPGVRVALVSISVSLPLLLLSHGCLHAKIFWGKSIINGLIHLPLILPPVVIGYC